MESTGSLVRLLSLSALSACAFAPMFHNQAATYPPAPVRARPAQFGGDVEISVGTVVCADRSLKDPNFAQTVILIVRYDEEGTLGLILNRRSEVPISKILGEWKEAKDRNEPLFGGGPVETDSLLALVRSRAAGENAPVILRGVRLVSDRAQLQRTLQTAPGPDKFRLYAGYAGWAPEQMEEELDAGAWHVIPADASTVFDEDPDSLWARTIKRVETQIAGRLRPRAA